MEMNDWPMLALVIGVALAVAAAAWAYVNRREPRATLASQHVAGAAIVALMGWEAVVYLPGAVAGYWALTAGLGDLRGLEVHQLYVVGLAALAIGSAAAVVGILRRQMWGIVLGIGLAVAQLALSIVSIVQTIVIFGGAAVGDAVYFETVGTTIALRAVPPIAAIVLLAWPLVRGSRTATPATPATSSAAPGTPHPDPAG
jgi:hypothetical protein